MEKLTLFVLIIAISLLSGCGSKNKSDEIKNYAFEQKSAALSPALQEKLGSWLTEGTVCYGLVVTVNSNGKILKGVPVKAKALSFNGDTIRMKALEKVNVAEIKGCTKMGLAKGELWWETEGDLFKTKEEAIAYLTEKGWN